MKSLLLLVLTLIIATGASAAGKCTGELKLKNVSLFSSPPIVEAVREEMRKKGIELQRKHNRRTSVITLDIKLLKVYDGKGANIYIKQKGAAMEIRGYVASQEELLSLITKASRDMIPDYCSGTVEEPQTVKHFCEGSYQLVYHQSSAANWLCSEQAFVQAIEVRGLGHLIGLSSSRMKATFDINQRNYNFAIIGSNFTTQTLNAFNANGYMAKFSTDFAGSIRENNFTFKRVESSLSYGLSNEKKNVEKRIFNSTCDRQYLLVQLQHQVGEEPLVNHICKYRRIN